MLKHLSKLNDFLKSNDLASLIKTADLKNFRTLELEKKLNELSSVPNVYFHMAAINKFGLNPKSHYNTPIGIFTYPLDSEHRGLLLSGKLPYVTDQEYIHFASPKNPAKILRFEEGFLSDDAYNDLKERLKDIFKDKYNPEEVGIAEVTSNLQTNSGKLWNVTRVLSKTPKNWTTLLYKLGFEGADDTTSCFGIIHPGEPCQAVFFSGAFLTYHGMEHNPFSLSITSPEEYHQKIKHNKSIDKRTLNEIEDRASRRQSLNKDAASTTNLLRQKYILENADAHEIIELCKNPNLHEEIQVALASGIGVLGIDESDILYTKRHLAKYNTNLCEKAQVILAETEDDYILNRLAAKPNLSKEIQIALAKIDNEDVHYALTNNFNLCKEAQELLINSSLDIRKRLAANPSLTKEMQMILARDNEKTVRLFLLDNVNLDKEVLEVLKQDEFLKEYISKNTYFNE